MEWPPLVAVVLAFCAGALCAFGLGFNVGYHKRQHELDDARREKWSAQG